MSSSPSDSLTCNEEIIPKHKETTVVSTSTTAIETQSSSSSNTEKKPSKRIPHVRILGRTINAKRLLKLNSGQTTLYTFARNWMLAESKSYQSELEDKSVQVMSESKPLPTPSATPSRNQMMPPPPPSSTPKHSSLPIPATPPAPPAPSFAIMTRAKRKAARSLFAEEQSKRAAAEKHNTNGSSGSSPTELAPLEMTTDQLLESAGLHRKYKIRNLQDKFKTWAKSAKQRDVKRKPGRYLGATRALSAELTAVQGVLTEPASNGGESDAVQNGSTAKQ